jgi:DNA sulfur modification protein DndC
MESLIDHGDDWMQPLLDYRDWLKEIREDHSMREPFRRNGQAKPGPFTLQTRQLMLKKLTGIEKEIGMEILPSEERKEIDRLWRLDGFNLDTKFENVPVGSQRVAKIGS